MLHSCLSGTSLIFCNATLADQMRGPFQTLDTINDLQGVWPDRQVQALQKLACQGRQLVLLYAHRKCVRISDLTWH